MEDQLEKKVKQDLELSHMAHQLSENWTSGGTLPLQMPSTTEFKPANIWKCKHSDTKMGKDSFYSSSRSPFEGGR